MSKIDAMSVLMRTLGLTLFVAFSASSPARTAEHNASCYLAQVQSLVANLRKSQKLKSLVVAKANRGAILVVEAVAGEEDWARISEGPDQGRYIHLSVMKIRFRQDLPACQTVEGPAEVTGDRVNVRQAPSISAAVKEQVFVGDPLTVSPAGGDWLKISWPENLQGQFIHADVVKVRLPTRE